MGFALFGPGDIVSVNSRVTSLVTAVTLVDNFVFATFLRNRQGLRGAISPWAADPPPEFASSVTFQVPTSLLSCAVTRLTDIETRTARIVSADKTNLDLCMVDSPSERFTGRRVACFAVVCPSQH